MIVWGHNHFTLKSVAPSEIGLFDPSISNVRFELIQKYGHLYFIPFIPLGKSWVVNKGSKDKYHCAPEIEGLLQQQFPMRTSIWAWTGPLIIIAGFILYSISSSLEHRRQDAYAKSSREKELQQLEAQVSKAEPGSYLMFNIKEKWESGYSSDMYPLKVAGNSKDSVTLIVADANFSSSEPVFNEDDLVKDARKDEQIVPEMFTVAKATLLQAIDKDDKRSQFAGITLGQFRAGASVALKKVMFLQGPLPRAVRMDTETSDGSYFELVNKGLDGHADSVKAADNNSNWRLSKQTSFKHGEVVAVKCEGTGDAVLYCSDANHKQYQFRLTKYANMLNVSPIVIFH